MPIPFEYQWEQSDTTILIQLKIKGVNKTKLDVQITNWYVKVNASPYVLELDLQHEINASNSSSTLSSEFLQIRLQKKKEKEWKNLNIENGHKIDEVLQRRLESIELQREKDNQARKLYLQNKEAEEKRLLEMQWEIEQKKRDEIKELKNQEKEQAIREVRVFESQSNDTNLEAEKDNRNFFEAEKKVATVPPVRKSSEPIRVKFTPRALNTPAREDKDEEMLKKYEVWKNQTKPKNQEEDPTWIKEKGDKFFKKGNWEAAINAYTECLKLTDFSFLSSLLNRAACYLQVKQFGLCIADCTTFLNWEENSPDPNSKKTPEMKVKALVRRSKSYIGIAKLKEALDDIESACELTKFEDTALLSDLKKVKELLREETVYDSSDQKHYADQLFSNAEYNQAVEVYSSVINSAESNLECYSNRAACLLRLNRFRDCIEDCTFIIENIYNSKTLQKTGSLILKAYIRRGSAYFSLGDLRKAYDDYESASRLNPSDEGIIRDMEKISKMIEQELKVDWLKNCGNSFYKSGEYANAIHSFSLAIDMDKYNPVLYSNRAACYLKLQQYIDCIKDVNSAFSNVPKEVVQEFAQKAKEMKNATEIDGIAYNPLLTKEILVKLYMRRAASYKELDEYSSALMDYTKAINLNPTLKKEVEPLIEQLQQQLKQVSLSSK